MAAEADTGCPRPLGRFPRWRVRDACSGQPGSWGRCPWLQSCSHPGAPEPFRDSAFRPRQASQPECASSAVFPAGACVTPAAAAVLPDPASPGCNRAARSGRGMAAEPPGTSDPAMAPECASTGPSPGAGVWLQSYRPFRGQRPPETLNSGHGRRRRGRVRIHGGAPGIRVTRPVFPDRACVTRTATLAAIAGAQRSGPVGGTGGIGNIESGHGRRVAVGMCIHVARGDLRCYWLGMGMDGFLLSMSLYAAAPRAACYMGRDLGGAALPVPWRGRLHCFGPR